MSINQKLARLGKNLGYATTKQHMALPPPKPTPRHQAECQNVVYGPPRPSCKCCAGTGNAGMMQVGKNKDGPVYIKLVCACTGKPPTGFQLRQSAKKGTP